MSVSRCLTVAVLALSLLSAAIGQVFDGPRLVRRIPVGKDQAQIGFDIGDNAGTLSSPQCFFFSTDSLVVIDAENSRFDFFDLEKLEYRKTIASSDLRNCVFAYSDGSSVWLAHNGTLSILDDTLGVVKSVPFSYTTAFIANGFLWYRNYTTGNMEALDKSGSRISDQHIQVLLSDMNKELSQNSGYSPAIMTSISSMLATGKVLIAKGKLYSDDFKQAQEFLRAFENTNMRKGQSADPTAQFQSSGSIKPIFVAVATDGTSCWKVVDTKSQLLYYVVFSPYGKRLAYFNIDNINPRVIRKALIKAGERPEFDSFIDPVATFDAKGNLWFMIGYPTAIEFYRLSVSH